MRNGASINTFVRGLVLAFVLFIHAAPGFAQTQAQAQALSEINTVVTGFKNLVNLHTAAGDLDYTHLLPYFDTNFKHDGAGPTEIAAEFANGLRAGSISGGTVESIVFLVTDANGNSKASTTGTFSATTAEGSFSQMWSPTAPDFADFAWYYKPAGGTWKLYGNQEPGKIRVKTFIENRQSGSGCQGCDGVSNFVWFDAQVPEGSVASVTVTGPGFNATPLVATGTQTKQEQASPPPAAPMSFSYQTFQFYGPAVSSLPPPGSVYTFTMTPASGAPFQVTRTVPQTTSETIAITSPTGHALADAHLGGALTLSWSLPTTFQVQNVDTYMVTNSAGGMCNGPEPNNSLPPNATSFTFSPVPTQCLGQPIADNVSQGYPVQVVVDVTGTNGEQTRAWYSFGTAACNGTNLPPGSLSASLVEANLVSLQWIRACMPTTIANYEVWRGTAPSGPFTKVGMTDQNTRNFNDNTASTGITYYYYVTANDTSGNHTGASNQITVTTPSGGVTVTTTTSTTTTTVGSTTTTTLGGTGGPVTLNFSAGWNLAGNSAEATLDMAAFADTTKVTTVWKWVVNGAKWAFYAPSLVGQALADYAASKGYDVLSTIAGGEGFWVNAKAGFTVQLPSANAISSASYQDPLTGTGKLMKGWNLIAIGDNKSASEFNKALSASPPGPGEIPLNLTTLWAWDGTASNWYFYAPSLEKSGGLASYIQSKNYLDFGTKKLDPAMGFWVNKP